MRRGRYSASFLNDCRRVGIEYIMGVVRLNEEADNLMILLNEKKLFSKDELLQLSK